MKSLQKLPEAAASSRGFRRWRRSVWGGVALAALFTSTVGYGQGNYYPVNPPGAPYGSTYTGITVNSNSDLQWLQQMLVNLYGPTVTLQVPIPTGSTAPTTAQYTAAVSAGLNYVVNGLAPAGITLSSFTNEAIGWRPADRAATATSIAQAILQFSADPATAVSNLTVTADALAKGQPTLIDTIMPSIFNVAAASPTAGVASSIPQLMATAAGDISADQARVASLLASGLGSISGSTLTVGQKTSAFIDPSTGVVNAFLGSAFANNNPGMIDNIVKTLVSGGYSSMASLTQVLNAAVAALPTKNNATLGAVVVGALRTQGGNASTIASVVASANAGTATYTNAVVAGYSNSGTLATFQNYVTLNPSVADALAAGAVVKGTLTAPVIVQWALRNGTADPKSVVAATIEAAPTSASATIVGAINTVSHTPWGTATFGDLAYGGATSAPVEQVGNVIQTILSNSSTGITALNSATVTSVVDSAIQGATDGGRANTYADIVYKAEVVARNTSGVSAQLVTHAVDSINAAGGPSYLAVVAALAGDAFGSNRAAIQAAGFAELTATNGDLTAAQSAANLITQLQTNAAKTFTNTLAAFNSAVNNGSPTNSVIANLYGAILANPTEADAGLAAALKQSTLSASTLLSIASDALRSSNTTYSGLNPALQMVRDVVTHIKASELAGATNDMVDFVSHQIVLNPSLLKDIVIAATVINPDNVNFVAHAAAFNKPLQVNTVVGSLFNYAQITATTVYAAPTALNPSGLLTTKAFPGTRGVVIDQPAVAAAITSALTTGILESNMSPTDTQTALVSTVTAAVAASISQNGTNLRGPTNPFNGADSAAHFRQSDGLSATTIKSGTQQTVGVAGAITGYIAEVTNAGDTTISAITKAVLTAAVGGGARPYALEMAQAAAQALRWVGGANVSAAASPTLQVAGNPAYDIALAMSSSVVGFATLPQLMNAAYFGITEAANGTIGAGALGLNATGLNPGTGTLLIKASGNANSDFYQHRSATGIPVTNIFNL